MSVSRFIIGVFAGIILFDSVSAIYDPSSRANVAVYWGQGAGQQRLLHFCQQSTIDIIPIGFMNVFPDQGNGFPGTNFGNQCWGGRYVYDGPGNNPLLNSLQTQCPQINEDIPVCQATYGKKIILSLGGGTSTYQLTGAASGVAFADFVWGAFGPQKADWVKNGLPRPFDSPTGVAVEVDGFDFDIEYPSTDNSAGYIAMINRLRTLFKTTSKQYLITGAPQCVTPDANMGQMIAQSQFDIIFVQYYNTPQCSARNWANANSNFGSSGVELASGFSYNAWASFLAGTASANAKLYIGLPGAPDAFYLTPDEIAKLAKAYFCRPNFGGIMIWEATVAENNPSGPYYTSVKNILSNHAADTSFPCYAARSSAIVARSTTVFSSSRTSSAKITTSTKALSTSIKPSTFITSIKQSISSKVLVASSKRTMSTLATSQKAVSSIKSSSKPLSVRATSSSKITTLPTLKLSSSSKPITAQKSSSLAIKSSLRLSSTTKKPLSSISSSTSVKASSQAIKLVTSTKSTLPTLKSSLSTPKPSSTKSTPSPSPPPVAPGGSCGSSFGSCSTGYCCSQWGFCGNTSDFCGIGCQKAFGTCSVIPTTTSSLVKKSITSTAAPKNTVVVPDGACGSQYGVACTGGNCCSLYGYCGTGALYCGTGCQVGFGVCA